jgi:hypothetical protein
MTWVPRLVETEIDRPSRVIDVLDIRPRGDLGNIANLGPTLAEAKQILARLQDCGRHSSRRSRGSASGLFVLPSCRSRQGLAASSGGDTVWHGGGAPPAISLRQMWSWRDGCQLAVVLPFHA